jgi:hypothetical protein
MSSASCPNLHPKTAMMAAFALPVCKFLFFSLNYAWVLSKSKLIAF